MVNMGVYRHISCLDVDILVVKRRYTHKDYLVLSVMYLDRKGNLMHEESQTVCVQKSDLWKWKGVS